MRILTAGSTLALQVNVERSMIIGLFLYVLLYILLKLLHFFVKLTFLGCAPVLKFVDSFLERFLFEDLTFFLEVPQVPALEGNAEAGCESPHTNVHIEVTVYMSDGLYIIQPGQVEVHGPAPIEEC